MDVTVVSKKITKANLAQEHFEKFACIAFASKTTVEDLVLEPGGSAANSAVTFSKLGGKAALLSAVGNDVFSSLISTSLKQDKVDVSRIKKIPGKSSVGVIIVDSSGEKSVLVHKGVNDLLSEKHFSDSLLKGINVVVLCSLASEQNFALFEKIVSSAKKLKKKIVFAPSITMLRSRSKELKKMHSKFDLTIMNLEEAFYYTGEKSLSRAFRKLGSPCVITADKQGAYAFDGRHAYHIHAPSVAVKDSTGAGDSFTGAFVHAFFAKDLKTALKQATAAAGLNLSDVGARFKFNSKDLASFIKKHSDELFVRTIE